MTTEPRHPPIHIEFVDEPVEAPCPDCGTILVTERIWRNYTDDWQPTDDIQSLDSCSSCRAEKRAKWEAHKAEVARQEAEREARRQEIFARSKTAEPVERQLGFGRLDS